MPAPILEVIDLHKRYGSTVALQGVSFEVNEGELFGLLGPNGAGKTTLLSIISGLLPATSGAVRILGRDLVRSDRELRRQIGIVPQSLAIYGALTARENLRFFGELYGVPGTELDRRVDEVLAAVGLEDRADRRVDTFSGGMMRRLNLGAALVHRPRLLLLDEPTTGVDPQSRNHIFEEVRRLSRDGVTVVYTSHYMEEVQALCTRIGIIDHGRLVACDTLPGLLRRLAGLIRFRVPHLTPLLRDRIRRLPGVRLREHPAEPENGHPLELECRDVKATLFDLVATLTELRIESVSLETEEPNLERVFLHLTGRELRD
ncbi:MAG TPA: ABC transporter ATP-binding protein [Gemmataceae bacterium]|nr:ABC transporter ATP-binding protein [Gemmataceae bacterium]